MSTGAHHWSLTLIQTDPIHTLTSKFLKTKSSTPLSSVKNVACMSHLFHSYYVFRPCHFPWISKYFMKKANCGVFIMQLFASYCSSLPLNWKYFLDHPVTRNNEHSVLTYLESWFNLYSERTHQCKTTGKFIVVYILIFMISTEEANSVLRLSVKHWPSLKSSLLFYHWHLQGYIWSV